MDENRFFKDTSSKSFFRLLIFFSECFVCFPNTPVLSCDSIYHFYERRQKEKTQGCEQDECHRVFFLLFQQCSDTMNDAVQEREWWFKPEVFWHGDRQGV
jgi:hypothetical protein